MHYNKYMTKQDWISKIIGKATPTWDDIQEFVNRKIPEGLNLEYTTISDNQRNLKEIIKEACAFCNADGGLLVLGVDEETNIIDGVTVKSPNSRLRGLKLSRADKRKVQDGLNGIHPILQLFNVIEIKNPSNNEFGIILVNVEKSPNPPHQSVDSIYYTRGNESSMKMPHFLVADYFNRRRAPKLELKVSKNTISLDTSQLTIDCKITINNLGKLSAYDTMLLIQISPSLKAECIHTNAWEFSSESPNTFIKTIQETPIHIGMMTTIQSPKIVIPRKSLLDLSKIDTTDKQKLGEFMIDYIQKNSVEIIASSRDCPPTIKSLIFLFDGLTDTLFLYHADNDGSTSLPRLPSEINFSELNKLPNMF
jgi:hypothetical protein